MATTNKKKGGYYPVLVYLAYMYFILFGGVWFFMNLLNGSHFNYIAFIIVAVFAVQAYHKNKLINLILGILALCFSIWMLLDVFSAFNLFAKNSVYDGLIKTLLTISILSIIMSGILVFSYMMLNINTE